MVYVCQTLAPEGMRMFSIALVASIVTLLGNTPAATSPIRIATFNVAWLVDEDKRALKLRRSHLPGTNEVSSGYS